MCGARRRRTAAPAPAAAPALAAAAAGGPRRSSTGTERRRRAFQSAAATARGVASYGRSCLNCAALSAAAAKNWASSLHSCNQTSMWAYSTMPAAASAGAVHIALLYESSWEDWNGNTPHKFVVASLARAHHQNRHLFRTRNYGGPVLHWGIYRWGYLYNYYSACCRHHSDIAHVVYEHLLHPSSVGRVMPLPLHRLTIGSTFAIGWSSDFDALSLLDQTSF